MSFFCYDTKILTNILVQRMQRCITKLIKPDQTDFIPGTRGVNNIRRTLNLMSGTKNNPQRPMIFNLDELYLWNHLHPNRKDLEKG